MKKLLVLPVLLIAMSFATTDEAKAQVLDGIYAKEHVPSRKPIPYSHLREADVMWAKRIWRIIDLREKINHPLYYPTNPIGDRMSLIDLFMWGINTEGLTAYSEADDRFTQPITRSQIDVAFGSTPKTITYTDENGNEVTEKYTPEVNTSEIQQYILKEDWFFDRQASVMDVRIIGICPVRFYTADEQTSIDGELTVRKSKVFWIYFPEARRILANHEVFNRFNDAERRTFDDIFFKRKFNSYIVAETNVHDDRQIQEYTLGVQSLLESKRIKKEIVDYEQDLWEY